MAYKRDTASGKLVKVKSEKKQNDGGLSKITELEKALTVEKGKVAKLKKELETANATIKEHEEMIEALREKVEAKETK